MGAWFTSWVSILLVTSIAAFLLSGSARLLVESSLHTRIPLLSDFVALEFVENRGIAFGIAFHPFLQFVLIALALLFVLFLAYQSRRDRRSTFALGMILGGAIANIIDRLDDGFVTDFISIGSFPTFNIADSCITMGVAVLLGWEMWKK
jgi:signal peptidase II